MHGGEVLRTIKADTDLRDIPIIVLSTSGDPKDIANSYRDHAHCYIRKPSDIGSFRDVMRKIEDFWFLTAQLP
jgi:CheY-like chemotaxis protein